MRVDLALGLRARRIGVELAAANPLQDGLGQDRSCGIARAEEQHVVGLGHDALLLFATGAALGAQEAPPQQFSVRKPTSPFMAAKSAE